MSNLRYVKFRNIDLNDPFFDSLKNDYKEFPVWFSKKAEEEAGAFIFNNDKNNIDGFLYLKRENEELNDTLPPLPKKHRLKIGTFKINPHGSRLGERFIKKVFDVAITLGFDEIYVTLFSKHQKLLETFEKYGFIRKAQKETSNGVELVLIKNISFITDNILKDYPNIPRKSNRYILSLYPDWHSRLLPDSILKTENPKQLIQDLSHTNSIHKIYLTRMSGTEMLSKGDTLVIYRTAEQGKAAEYSSVATSICVVEEVRNIDSFSSLNDFLKYTSSYSIFTNYELERFYKSKKYPVIIKFTYNIALKKRIIRKKLIEEVGLNRNSYWGFLKINENQFNKILKLGEVNESFIINKT
ncbi:Uncharacterised protein [Phocoenobacter uteri]|uniref:N-acetyltransferase domain-containing protein n=1 Tax=Phocoenobacter uteri TaxID=146806 RepID=A0A379CBD9_9PAST|nr:N-acetyltransferase [Phocoenobacter uteri]MDG6880970.1 acetyltransferase [Phocoenobacter uteri]SUB58987.1 Uncharacterised protein [Phocoenobacter uteri]